ncbi:MAG: 50S ribosomal protein L4 [Acidobacteria bacterium]|nr:50S ribosomal protein L4 [Acidobacteriota bacterium]
MPTVDVKNLNNDSVGQLELNDEYFGVPLNEALIYDAIKNYLANQRQGTVMTKTRGNVSGSGRKLWKQKGTGRARIASLRSPLWKGGGNVHGPQPRDWSSELPRKMKRRALVSALSERLREGNLIVVDAFPIDAPKTKAFAGIARTMGWESRTLIVEAAANQNLILSSRNIPGVKVSTGVNVNIYDVLYHEKIVFTREAISLLQERLSS